jgi:hypothetical protein
MGKTGRLYSPEFEEEEELRRLPKGVKVHKVERESLKEAATFFAGEEDLRARG